MELIYPTSPAWMEERTIFPFIFSINHSEALSYRISFPLDHCPFMVTPVPPGMLSQSPWAILITLVSRGAEKQKTYSISQEALSCHSCCSHYHTTLLGKHQESGYTCATLHVHYLRILCHLGHVLPPKSGNQSAGTIPVLWRNSLGPPRITWLCCFDHHFLQMRGRRKSLSTCRHTQLPSSPTTQNVAVLWLLGSSSLQHCTPRAFAQGNVGSARTACSWGISISAPRSSWSPPSHTTPCFAAWLASHYHDQSFTTLSIQVHVTSR